jgi:sulfur-oxidizing protein SoxB
LKVRGNTLNADQRYRVAGWAPVAEGAGGEPIWELVARYLRAKKTVPALRANSPRLIGVKANPGIAA